MFAWISANAPTLLISAVLIAAVILAVRSIVKKKGACSCGCGGCSQSSCPACGTKK